MKLIIHYSVTLMLGGVMVNILHTFLYIYMFHREIVRDVEL